MILLCEIDEILTSEIPMLEIQVQECVCEFQAWCVVHISLSRTFWSITVLFLVIRAENLHDICHCIEVVMGEISVGPDKKMQNIS